jgi:CBS domain containing-hemolysin-like protein
MSVSDKPEATGDGENDPGLRLETSDKPRLFDRLRALFGLGPPSIRDDIQDALEDATTTADFSPQERAMLKNVLGLHDVRVADIMLPRADIVAVSADASLADVLSLFRTAGHSRLPVYGDTLDDPRGMVHIRDFLDYLAAIAASGQKRPRKPRAKSGETAKLLTFGNIDLSKPLGSANILRPVLFVPPSMPALDLLVKMQATRTHMALVIDEYGGTDGLVSIEDIVEMIVGDIEDEHDETDTPVIQASADGSFITDARASLEDVSKALGLNLNATADAEEVDTIGGLITTLAGRVPVRGEIVTAPDGLEFEILDADPRRLKRIRIHRTGAPRSRRGPVRRPRDAIETDEGGTHSPPKPAPPEPAPPEPAPPEPAPPKAAPDPDGTREPDGS